MFEQLLQLVKQNAGESIINNPAVPNEQNEEVINTASTSIMDTLKGLMNGGQSSNLLNLFNNQNSNNDVTNHPVTQNVSTNLISTLMSKFGMDSNKAGGIASTLIPLVMNNLVSKTNDSNDNSFNLQGIIGSLTGKNTNGMDIGSLLSQFGGNALDKNHDGKVNLEDISAALNSNQNTTSKETGGGGILDSLKGLFGK